MGLFTALHSTVVVATRLRYGAVSGTAAFGWLVSYQGTFEHASRQNFWVFMCRKEKEGRRSRLLRDHWPDACLLLRILVLFL